MATKPFERHLVFIKQTFSMHGGLEKYCLQLAHYFSSRGYKITILSSTLPDQTTRDLSSKNPHIHYIELATGRVCSFIRMIIFDYKVRKWLQKMQKVYVFGFDRHFIPLSFYRAGNGCHKAYLNRRKNEASFFKKITLRLNPLHYVTLLSEKMTFQHRKTHIICNSHMVEQEIKTLYPQVCTERLHVIHNGVDWVGSQAAFEASLINKKSIRHSWNVPLHALHIVCVGHEWHRKGVDILLRSLPLVIKALPEIPLYITVAGKEKKPCFFTKLARTLNIDHLVQFVCQPISSLSLFQASDIAVIASRYDPFANVTVEALAMGLWVVTSHENGGCEVIKNEQNGYVALTLSEQQIAYGLISGIRKILSLQSTKEHIRNSIRSLDYDISLKKYKDLIEKSIVDEAE